MARFFNTTGPCVPEWHYMLPAEARLPELATLETSQDVDDLALAEGLWIDAILAGAARELPGARLGACAAAADGQLPTLQGGAPGVFRVRCAPSAPERADRPPPSRGPPPAALARRR